MIFFGGSLTKVYAVIREALVVLWIERAVIIATIVDIRWAVFQEIMGTMQMTTVNTAKLNSLSSLDVTIAGNVRL